MDGGGCRLHSRRTGYTGVEGHIAHLHLLIETMTRSEASA
jgi:hypothetical protein